MLKWKSGQYYTNPLSYPHISPFRLVDMYTQVLTIQKKSEVLEAFSKVTGKMLLQWLLEWAWIAQILEESSTGVALLQLRTM